MKIELRRTVFDEQMRTEKRRSAGTAIESQVTGSLKPWREVVNPHKDVASGRYQQAEFAADLLVGAVTRLSDAGGDPVIQLQTNFGGGKTHSMLALYHLFSGTPPNDLLGIDAVLNDAGVTKLPKVKRVVLVGHKI